MVTLTIFLAYIAVLTSPAWTALPAGEVTITFHANDTLGNEQTYPVTVTKEAPDEWGWVWPVGIASAALVIITVSISVKKRRKRRVMPYLPNPQQPS